MQSPIDIAAEPKVVRLSDDTRATAAAEASLPDATQLEAVLLNLDAALRVHSRPHFFNWTQGLLQSLIRHEVLVCALRNGQPLSFRAESFATGAPNAAVFGDAFLQDSAVAPNLIKAWEENRFRPLVCDASGGGPFAGGALARELQRIGATRVIAHGMHDANAQVVSLFAFACLPQSCGPRQDYFVELLAPSLHCAWLRTQVNRAEAGVGAKQAVAVNPLTAREKEILGWIYLGKSNYEVGAILKISPLTVKNHVQKILRKLDVVNRTQAVGKALETRILSP